MKVRELVELLRVVPANAEIRLCVCVGDQDNPAALAEVAFCEALEAEVAPADLEGLELGEDGVLTIRGWYGSRTVDEKYIGRVEVERG